jgi:predicted RNA-binding protein YlxR (DUF448 family)
MIAATDNSRPPRRSEHAGTRTCIGCGARVARDSVRRELVRLVVVRGDDDVFRAVVDLAGGSTGRGVWVHARSTCLASAARRGLARAARGRVAADAAELTSQIRAAAERRAAALLASANRAGKAVVGSSAVAAADGAGRVRLLVVARDAAAAAHRPWVARAIEAGRVLAWGDKASLAQMLGWPRPVAVVAVTDDGLAAALQHAAAFSEIL